MKYFETKVIKVKKKRELYINPRGAGKSTKYWSSFSDEKLDRLGIGLAREWERRDIKRMEKPKGNWVNGENLEKIKFPCFCSWNIPLDNKKQYGLLIGGYLLYSLQRQSFYNIQLVAENKDLKELIKRWNIHILKGKIIIYEDEDTNEKYDIDIEEEK